MKIRDEGITIDGRSLRVDSVVAVARGNAHVKISEDAKRGINKSRELVEKWVSERRVIYGITTGCGPLCNRLIPLKKTEKFQENLIHSHSAGVGDFLQTDVVRATMLLRANSLARGRSGIKLTTLETLVELINAHIHPLIPEIGSVGASGDLIPLSHMALAIMGEGEVEYTGCVMNARNALKEAEISKVKLSYKEGLALINGTSLMTGIATLAVNDAGRLVKIAEINAIMGLEALKGTVEPFDERIHRERPHPGQIISAMNLRRLAEGSKLIKTADKINKALQGERKQNDGVFKAKEDIQNAYTLRCSPQVLGAVRDSVSYVKQVVEIEMNSSTDNPLIFSEDEEVLHGGNFHGQPVAIAMDILGIVLAEVGTISERRIARLLDERLNEGLPAFLVKGDCGLQNGFMGIQYVPTSLVAENRVLASPVSIESISTNANNQDIVSMGTIAARKAINILKNVRYILGVELLCAAQAIDFQDPENAGRGTKEAHKIIRKHVPVLTDDRILYPDINKMVELIQTGTLLDGVENVVGELS